MACWRIETGSPESCDPSRTRSSDRVFLILRMPVTEEFPCMSRTILSWMDDPRADRPCAGLEDVPSKKWKSANEAIPARMAADPRASGLGTATNEAIRLMIRSGSAEPLALKRRNEPNLMFKE